MFWHWRYGHSWPNRYGGRSWVSGPLWAGGFGWFGSVTWWLFVGWWIWPLYLGFVLGGWVLVQALLLLISLIWAGWALWSYARYRRRFRGEIRWLTPYWFILDQVEVR